MVFYAEPKRSKRKRSWDLLKFMRREYNNLWLCAGDFNEVLYASEQFGGNAREEWKMRGLVKWWTTADLMIWDTTDCRTPGTIDSRVEGTLKSGLMEASVMINF